MATLEGHVVGRSGTTLTIPDLSDLDVDQNILSKWVGHCALRDWPILAPSFLSKLLGIQKKMMQGSDWILDLHQLQWKDFPGGPSGYVERHYYAWWTEGRRYLKKAPDSLGLVQVLNLFRFQVCPPAISWVMKI